MLKLAECFVVVFFCAGCVLFSKRLSPLRLNGEYYRSPLADDRFIAGDLFVRALNRASGAAAAIDG